MSFRMTISHKVTLVPGVITAVEVVDGSGQVSIQNGRVIFAAATAGAHTLRYTVDGQYKGTVSVWIENVARPDQAVVDENSQSQDIAVLANDFYINYPPLLLLRPAPYHERHAIAAWRRGYFQC